MDQLPFIDTHSRRIDAPPELVWTALIATVRRMVPRLPDWLIGAWGLRPATARGAWDGAVKVGDRMPGFSAAEVLAPERLTLRGSHRFSVYELGFELERSAAGTTMLRATSSAAFPGFKGRVYRALVIESGGHRVAVRRLLASVEQRTARPG